MFLLEPAKLWCLIAGEMIGNVKVEKQDNDGQEEKAPPSPAEEWDGPSKIPVQSRFVICCQHRQIKRYATGGVATFINV